MKKSFYKKTRKGLPGGPNEQISIIEGSISMQGYKSDSPDVNNDFNIIPTGNITMEDVDFPVLGIDNLGNSEIMMPGANYIFPGNFVFEVPLVQKGKEIDQGFDPEMMFRDKYNTKLTKDETVEFNKWVKSESARQGRDIMMDMGAYDIQGFWKSGDYLKMDEDNHGSDRWKKPNHPTFSNQSVYHNVDGFKGGTWQDDGGYIPSEHTKKLYDVEYYNWMFGSEPHRPEYLVLPNKQNGGGQQASLSDFLPGLAPLKKNNEDDYQEDDEDTTLQKLENRVNNLYDNIKMQDPPATKEEEEYLNAFVSLRDRERDLINRIDPKNAHHINYIDNIEGEIPEEFKAEIDQLNADYASLDSSDLKKKMDAQTDITSKYKDPIRHAYTSANLAKEMEKDVSNLPYVGGALNFLGLDKAAGVIGSNLLGIGHEAQVFQGDDRPFLTKLKESGQDIYNNILGSYIGVTSDSDIDAYNEILRRAKQDKFAEGFVKQFGGDSTNQMSNEAKEILYSYADASKLEQDIVEGKVTNPEVIEYVNTLRVTGVPEMYPGANEDLKKFYETLPTDKRVNTNLTGEQIAKAAEKLYEEKTDITRGPAGRKEKLINTLFPVKGCYFDNTCVQAVKDIYKEANIESNIPDDVYDNRTFFENYESYGYELIEDPNDLQRGDILQYYFPARDAFTVETLFNDIEIDAMGDYPFHIGVYVGDEMYISDPDENNPLTKSNIYKDEQGKEKPPFQIFRKIDNKLAKKKVGVELRKNKNKKTLELIKKFKGGENISSAGKQYLKELGYIR
mgnify:CR=1 FL=1